MRLQWGPTGWASELTQVVVRHQGLDPILE